MLRRIVAFFGHAPGLWLMYREPLPKPVRRPNAIAVGLTLAAMVAAGVLAPAGQTGWAVLVTWVVGHFAWGTWLALKLPEPDDG